jgi:hypothetical protein
VLFWEIVIGLVSSSGGSLRSAQLSQRNYSYGNEMEWDGMENKMCEG